MNKLVMNFMVTEGYVEAAEKFRQESGTEIDIDLSIVQDRLAIKRRVQCGNVEGAIEKLNRLNPELLDTNPEVSFHLQQQLLIEMIRDGKVDEALDFAQVELTPRAEENQGFLEELERTIALLAFDNPYTSPVGDLLAISHRLKTAHDVNEAILISQTQEKEAKLPTILQMLSRLQIDLEFKAFYPRMNLTTTELEDPRVFMGIRYQPNQRPRPPPFFVTSNTES